jgi:hypothetical protein
MQVISYRNNFNKLLGTPYNNNEPYEIAIHRLHSKLYLNIRHLDTGKVCSE